MGTTYGTSNSSIPEVVGTYLHRHAGNLSGLHFVATSLQTEIPISHVVLHAHMYLTDRFPISDEILGYITGGGVGLREVVFK